jgi:hypothetical protein
MFNELKIYIFLKKLNNILMYMLRKKDQIHYKVIMIWTYENMAHFKSLKIP